MNASDQLQVFLEAMSPDELLVFLKECRFVGNQRRVEGGIVIGDADKVYPLEEWKELYIRKVLACEHRNALAFHTVRRAAGIPTDEERAASATEQLASAMVERNRIDAEANRVASEATRVAEPPTEPLFRTMSTPQSEPSSAYELSDDARLVLTYLYSRYRDNDGTFPSYVGIATSLSLTEQSVDEAVRELSECGYVGVIGTFQERVVMIADAGKVEACRDRRKVEASTSRRKPKHWLRRAGSWILTHIVATIVAGVILAAVLTWMGFG